MSDGFGQTRVVRAWTSPVDLVRQQAAAALVFVVLAATIATPAFSQRLEDLAVAIDEAFSAETASLSGVPDGLTAQEWADVQAQIAALQAAPVLETAVTVEPVALPTLRTGPDSAVSFRTSGAEYVGDAGTIRFGTVAVGGAAALAATPLSETGRVVYSRGAVEEWWQETAAGVEHGYVVAERPAGVTDELVAEIAVATDLAMALAPGENAVHFLDAEGEIAARYAGLLVTDASGATLPSSMSLDGERILLSATVADAVWPVTIDPTLTEDQVLLAEPSRAGNRTGSAVDADASAAAGPVAVVASVGDDRVGRETGSVSVYRKTGGSWTLEQVLEPDEGIAQDDDFGASVAVADDLIAVGAPGNDENGVDAGLVYLYEFDGSTWNRTFTLYECDTDGGPCNGQVPGGLYAGHQFGAAVAIAAETGQVVVGAPESDALAAGGAAYLYGGIGFVTTSAERMPNPNDAAGDGFGAAVAVEREGKNIFVGAPGFDYATATDGGAAWWISQSGGLDTPTLVDGFTQPSTNQQFGAVITTERDSLGNTVVVVGAPGDGSTVPRYDVYRILDGLGSSSNGEQFRQGTTDPSFLNGVGDLDFDGARLLSGRPLAAGVGITTWDAASATPTFQEAFSYGDATSQDGVGLGLAIAGAEIVVGLPDLDEDDPVVPRAEVGEVRFSETSASNVIAAFTAEPAVAGERMGAAVAIDGDLMAVGLIDDDNPAAAGGSVYVYRRASASASWSLAAVLTPPPGEAMPGADFGRAVDVFGNNIVVGDPDVNGDGSGQGAVYVFADVGSDEWEPVSEPIFVDGDGGAAVAFAGSADRILIGAPLRSEGAGRVFEYEFSEGWFESGILDPGGLGSGSEYGIDLAVAGEPGDLRVVVGAPGQNGLDGRVHVFVDFGSGFVYDGSFDADPGSEEELGSSVAVGDASTYAAAGFGGRVYVREDDGESTTTVLDVTVDGSDAVVDMSDGTLVVSYVPTGSPGAVPVVDVYQRGLSGWSTTPAHTLLPAGVTSNAIGFESIAVDGSSVVWGLTSAVGVSAGSLDGAAFAYELPSTLQASADISGQYAAVGLPDRDEVIVLRGPVAATGADRFTPIGTIAGPAGSGFGASVAIDDRVLVIGAPNDDTDGSLAGAVFVYVREDGASTYTPFAADGRVTGNSPSPGDRLGWSVDAAGGSFAAGAPGAFGGGQVGVWRFSVGDTSPEPLGVVEHPDFPADGAEFGASVAFGGYGELAARLWVGAPGSGESGEAFLFEDGEGYSSLGSVGATGDLVAIGSLAGGERFGESIDAAATSGNKYLAVVGAPGAGTAFVVDVDPGGFGDFFEIDGPEGATNFGRGVSISGDTVALSSDNAVRYYSSNGAARDADSAIEQYEFVRSESLPGPIVADVAVEGDIALFAIPDRTPDPYASSAASGLAGFVSTIDSFEATKLVAPFPADGDQTAEVVALDGSTLVVASRFAAADDTLARGLVHVFAADPDGFWTLQQTFESPVAFGPFAEGIAIDGNVLAVTGADVVWFATRPDPAAPFGPLTVLPYGGQSIDTDGDTLVVGNRENNVAIISGGPGAWPTATPIIHFAFSPNYAIDVAVDGDIVVVGQAPDAVEGEPGGSDYGSIDIFRRVAGAFPATPTQTFSGERTTSGWSDAFGASVDVDGDVVVVGAPFDLDRLGQVYVYDCNGVCEFDTTLLTPTQGGEFGLDVQVDGDLILTNARLAGPLAELSNEGYLFRRVNGSWYNTATYNLYDAESSDAANALGLTDGYLVMGAPEEDQFGAQAGAAYVWPVPPVEKITDPFGLPQSIGLPSEEAQRFPTEIAVDGDTMVVGVPTTNPIGGGRAVVFVRNPDGVWEFQASLKPSGFNANSTGNAVAIEGDTAVVGSGCASPGGVHVFERSEGIWTEVFSEIGPGENGCALAIQGDLIVSGHYRSDDAAPQAGALRLYERLEGEWTFTTTVVAADAIAGEAMGESVDIDGSLIVAGDSGFFGAGRVHVFENQTGGWIDVATLSDPGAPDLGAHVAIVGDTVVARGRTGSAYAFDLAAGNAVTEIAGAGLLDRAEDGLAFDGSTLLLGYTGGLADNTGVVAVFDGPALGWAPRELLSQPDPATSGVFEIESFGNALALDGDTALVGAINDSNGRGRRAGSIYSLTLAPAVDPDDPMLDFSFGLGAGETGSVAVAPSGIAISQLSNAALEKQANASTLASAPLGQTELQDSPLSSLALDETPIPQVILDNPALYNLPLIQIQLDQPGGWSAILAGTDLETRPLQDITFGEVLDATQNPSVAGEVASLPLSSLDVNGTPLSSLPLSSLVLGDTPLSSLPLSSLGIDICAELAPFLPGVTCGEINDLSLTEATLRGAPLSSLPLSSLPLSSLPLSSLPLSSLPLSSLELQNSPLSSLPLSSLPLSSLPLSSLPLSSLPLSSLPLSSLPLSSLGLDSLPLSSLPLSSLPLSSLPLSSLTVEGAPLSSLPLSSLPLSSLAAANTPLSSLPLSSLDGGPPPEWCDLLADIDVGYDCTTGVDPASTTIVELALRGVPLSSLPLSSLPLSSLPLSSLPLSSLPLSSLPLSSLPLSSLPLSSLDLAGTPLSSLPVIGSSVAGLPLSSLDVLGSPLSSLPLSSLPLSSLDVSGTPLSSLPLSSLNLSSLPLSSLPLSSLDVSGTPLSSLPLSSLDLLDSPLSSLPLSSLPLSSLPAGSVDCSRVDCEVDTLGDALLAGGLDTSLTLVQIQTALAGIRLGDLVPFFITLVRQDFRDAVDGTTLTLGDLVGLDDLSLGDLPLTDALVAGIVLGDLAGVGAEVDFGALVGALRNPATGVAYDAATVQLILENAIAGQGLTLAELLTYGGMTLGDALAGGDGGIGFGLDELGPFLGFLTQQQLLDEGFGTAPDYGATTLGDLTEEELGALTIEDLIGLAVPQYDTLTLGELLDALDATGSLLGFVLADLLEALVGIEDAAFGGVDFAAVEAGSLPAGTVPDVAFEAQFTLSGVSNNRAVDVSIELPATATYVPGTAVVTTPAGSSAMEPTIVDNTATWRLFGVAPDAAVTIDFDIRPEVSLGTSSLAATGRIVGTDISVSSSAAVAIAEGLENNDYPLTTLVADDTVYLTYIATPTDRDVFEITVGERDRLAIQLSNLTADLDLVLYGDPDDVAVGSALTQQSAEAPLTPITDPDGTSVESESLDDFPRLDFIDPTLQLLEVSNSAGLVDELIISDPLAAGTYYVQVHGANGATNVKPATLQIQTLEADTRPECSTLADIVGGLPVAAPGTLPPADPNANTLFLVNEQRLEQLFGPAGRADVMGSLDALVLYLETNTALGIDPIVVPVDAYASVQAAYAAWDDPVVAENACDPEVANAVVQSIIANAVDPIRAQLDHVVIVGGDDIIPMARLKDATGVANEYDYRNEFDGDLNGPNADNVSAFSASFWEARYLSDDPYGEAAARSLGDRYLYVPDVALGRVLETPAEIASALDTFVTFDGNLEASTAAVLGYDFLVDSSTEIASDLADAGLTVDGDLADGIDSTDGQPWDRADAEARLVPDTGSAADLISLNGHFDHYRALPAAGDQVPGFLDNVETSAIADALPSTVLEGTVLFSAGCHGGLSVSDVQIGNTNLDWAQATAQADAILIGNTGFGYGDTASIAYTERLMTLFTEEVANPLALAPGQSTTIGQAFAVAKNRFIADTAVLSVYDEKAVMEATFYGLPFYRVGLETTPAPDAPANAPTPDSTGTPAVAFAIDAVNDPNVTPQGTFYSNPDASGDPQVISVPGRPIQPSTTNDVSVVNPADTTALGLVAHGALVTDMTSTYVTPTDPVIATAVFDESDEQPEPPVGTQTFPAKPVTINRTTTATGERQSLVTATGKFRSDGSVQRLDDDIRVLVYYADPAETDFSPPRISNVTSTLESGLLTVSLTAVDAANAVDRVHLLVAENPGAGTVDWFGLDLSPVGSSGVWAGSIELDAATTAVAFLVQAKDTVGNIGFASNKAGEFSEDGTAAPPPPVPIDVTVDVDQSGFDVASGWYTGNVSVTVGSADPTQVVSYSVDGGPSQPIVPGGSFVIVGDGIHTFTVTTGDGEAITRSIRIDSTGAPTFRPGVPIAGGSYRNDLGLVFDFQCLDPSLQSCTATVGGVPVESGSTPLPTTPGMYVLTVSAVDALGNAAVYTTPFDITAPVSAEPEIVDIAGPGAPQNIVDGVTIDVTFDDADGTFDDYTVEVDWGDLDELQTPGSSTVCTATSDGAQTGNPSCEITAEPSGTAGGTATASFVYSAPGVYTVRATVTDSAGNSDTSVFEFVVVFNPAGGRVSGSGLYFSGPEAYDDGDSWGEFAIFGYNARYRNATSTEPVGNTRLRLLGDFFFRSTAYDYLIVNETMAVAEGTGRIGSDSEYRFRVQGVDNGWVDYFQITIWHDDTGEILYDNGVLYDNGDLVLLGGIRVKP